MELAKPFLLLACVAFAAGFMGYLGLARISQSAAAEPAPAWSSTVSAPIETADIPGKRI